MGGRNEEYFTTYSLSPSLPSLTICCQHSITQTPLCHCASTCRVPFPVSMANNWCARMTFFTCNRKQIVVHDLFCLQLHKALLGPKWLALLNKYTTWFTFKNHSPYSYFNLFLLLLHTLILRWGDRWPLHDTTMPLVPTNITVHINTCLVHVTSLVSDTLKRREL